MILVPVTVVLATLVPIPAAPAGAALPARAGDQSADWPQVGFDGGRSFHNPDEHVLNRHTVRTLSKAWSVHFDDLKLDPYDSLVVVDGIIYVNASVPGRDDDVVLVAISETNHEVLWTRHRVVGSLVGSSDGAIISSSSYYGVSPNTTQARSSSDGRVLWTSRHVRVEVIDGGVGYGRTSHGRPVAVDLATGGTVWEKPHLDDGVAPPHFGDVAVSDGVVLVFRQATITSAIADGYIFARGPWIALDAASGARLTNWHRCPSSDPSNLCFVDAKTFEQLGSVPGGYDMSISAVGTNRDGHPVAFSVCDPRACRMNAHGGIDWIVPASVCCYPYQGPILAGDVVYYQGLRFLDDRISRWLAAFDRAGHLLLRLPMQANVAAVANGTVFAIGQHNTVVALQPA
jgi:outer membrane protein assembly factor BamB